MSITWYRHTLMLSKIIHEIGGVSLMLPKGYFFEHH